MSNSNLLTIAQQLSKVAMNNNTLNGYSFDPHFRGKVKEIRGMGYTPIAAILEFTDNSIRRKCGSKRVVVKLHRTFDPPYYLDRISILDDGCGMTFPELCNSFIFNIVKDREDGDIGKFHVGGKYAAIALGDELMIISKREGGDTVGLYADIRQMQEKNSFAPTDTSMNVTDEWAMRKIPPVLWEQFKAHPSGTLIHIPTLVSNVRTDFGRYLEEFARVLSTSYTALYNECVVVLEDQEKVVAEIQPIDLFYTQSPGLLDEEAYETTLHIYNAGHGVPPRVIEKNTKSRTLPNKKMRCGTPTRPHYFEFKAPHHQKKKGRASHMIQIDASAVPDAKDLIDTLHTRIIQVSEAAFKEEKKYFPDNSRLTGDRKGWWFNREIRNVGAAKQLNKKLGDRTSMAAERQRSLSTFTDKLDEQVGSKFNKQMDDNALPCSTLDTAIKEIYKQVTGPWVKNWKPREKKESQGEDDVEDVEYDEEENDEVISEGDTSPTKDFVDVIRALGSNTPAPTPAPAPAPSSPSPSPSPSPAPSPSPSPAPSPSPSPSPSEELEESSDHEDTAPAPIREETTHESPLSYNAQTNTILFTTITHAVHIMSPPGNSEYLYQYLKTIPDQTVVDELMETLNRAFTV